MTESVFYNSLSQIEQEYWHQLADLFQLVNPQKPEKGIQSLILRARKSSGDNQSSLEQELDAVFQGAKERTLRRVALLNTCQLLKNSCD